MLNSVLVFAQWGLGLSTVKYLFERGFNLVVVTENRSAIDYGGAVYQWCIDNDIEVFDVCTLNGWESKLQTKAYSLVISSGFGKKIPFCIYGKDGVESINLHQSILPKYRGPDPISNAIKNGDLMTGMTAHRLEEKYDSGDIFAQLSWAIGDADTLESLNERCKKMVGLILNLSINLISSNILPVPQDHSKATKAPKIGLPWNVSVREIRES